MILSSSIKKANIITNPRAKNRWDLINEMLELAVRNGELNAADQETVRSSLVEREKSMSTGIGKGVAIPHCTTDKINDIIIILATCRSGVDFDSVDNLPVRIAILLLVPKNKLTQHIKTLANIAKLMNNDALRENLFTMKSPDAIIKAIQNYEESAKK
ncbi:MAG: PTS sugar transporter subunit IIA [Spirochaetes bacterium]|nr:PTS sugar transporter subunit IIA [Spirochaetota bacterium]HPA71879.1 PTS sugar transporter subunit IIA [Spirochaetota bacterium]